MLRNAYESVVRFCLDNGGDEKTGAGGEPPCVLETTVRYGCGRGEARLLRQYAIWTSQSLDPLRLPEPKG